VHEAFTALSMRRASIDHIVAATADMLETPVVLEDLNRQVLSFAARDTPTAVLLADWERRSRLAAEDSWTARPVGPFREVWGRLIAPEVADADSRTVTTLERAAQALALHRMAEQNRSSLELRAQSGLVDDLRRGRIVDEAEATARAHALGLRPALAYVPMAARLLESTAADQVVVQQRRVRTLDAMMHAVRSAGHTGLAATRDDGQIDLVLAPQRIGGRGGSLEGVLGEVCADIRRAVTRLDGVSDCVIGVGPESSRLVDAAARQGFSSRRRCATAGADVADPVRPAGAGFRRDRTGRAARPSGGARRRGVRPAAQLSGSRRQQGRAGPYAAHVATDAVLAAGFTGADHRAGSRRRRVPDVTSRRNAGPQPRRRVGQPPVAEHCVTPAPSAAARPR